MSEVRALVAAAGRGTRAGLPYPKTLFPIQGLPILVRIASLLEPYDKNPTVIVSPEGKDLVAQSLLAHALNAELIIQAEPLGMGDAVLRFKDSPAYDAAEHVLLIWGDIPFVQPATVNAMVTAHLLHQNDFTLVTRLVDSAYTFISRNQQGEVAGLYETRELGISLPPKGERDIGLFIFRKQPVFEVLLDDFPGKYGKKTGEHGFLYVIGQLAEKGFRVEALPVATEIDLVSLNSMEDINDYL